MTTNHISDRRAILLMSDESAERLEKLLKAHVALVREPIDIDNTMELRRSIAQEINLIREKRNQIIEAEKFRILHSGLKRNVGSTHSAIDVLYKPY